MFRYDTISSDCGTYKLSALFYDDGYGLASLTKEVNFEEVFSWDNDSYLYHTLIPKLSLEEAADDILEFIPLSDFGDVLEMLKEGDKIGFFNKLKQKQNE